MVTDPLPERRDMRPEPAPSRLANPATVEEHQPASWHWPGQTSAGAAGLADALDRFVAFYNHRYAWNKDLTSPACWADHGALVEEITMPMWSRWAAFQGPLASPDAAQNWHTHHLPLFVTRITTWIGAEAVIDCRAGHHQTSRLARSAIGTDGGSGDGSID